MTYNARNRISVRILIAALIGGVLGLTAAAQPAPVAVGIDLNAEQRVLIAQLTADKAITVARERRIAEADQEKLYEQLKVKDQALRVAKRQAAGNAAELAEVRKARGQIARERQALVAALADRDRTLAAEVRAYREVVTGIATSPDPRKQQALQRFADGEQREALADLDVILDAERAAQLKAVDIQDAAKRRPVAALALQAHDQGKVTLDEVIGRYEQLTRLDPGMTWDWIYLGWLYTERGQLDQARQSAESAYRSLAGGDGRNRMVVLSALGDVAVQTGDLAGARARFEECLAIARKLAHDNPSSAAAQRDVSVSLERLGNVAVEAGDLAGARARFEECLAIDRKLAKDNSSSAQAQRDVSVDLDKLGDVAVEAGDLAGARARFEESLTVRRKLAKDNPTSAEAQRDVSVDLERLGTVAVEAGDLAGARARFEECLAILRKLAKDNPNSAQAQRDVSVSLNNLGDVAVETGDLAGAQARFEESLTVRRKLAKDNPTSAEAQRDVSISLERLGDVAVQAGDLVAARARFEEGLAIDRKLAKNNPNSAEVQLDLVRSLAKLGKVIRDRALVSEALTIVRELERTGRLALGDRGLPDLVTSILNALP
jgi:tetratricopeptide (TPR) repeat protein